MQGDDQSHFHTTIGGSHSRHHASLTDLERGILDIASRTYRHTSRLERDARDELGLTPAQYLVRLNRLIDDERALAYAPSAVHRLHRQRETSRT